MNSVAKKENWRSIKNCGKSEEELSNPEIQRQLFSRAEEICKEISEIKLTISTKDDVKKKAREHATEASRIVSCLRHHSYDNDQLMPIENNLKTLDAKLQQNEVLSNRIGIYAFLGVCVTIAGWVAFGTKIGLSVMIVLILTTAFIEKVFKDERLFSRFLLFGGIFLSVAIVTWFEFGSWGTCGKMSCSQYKDMGRAYALEVEKALPLGNTFVRSCSGSARTECLKYLDYWCDDNGIKGADPCATAWNNFFDYLKSQKK